MKGAGRFLVHPGWKIIITDLGVSVRNVLKYAELPTDLLARENISLTTPDYFRLWRGLENAAGDRDIALPIGTSILAGVFEPSIFACLCSPNLNTALYRLAQYKLITCPTTLDIDIDASKTRVIVRCVDYTNHIPNSYSATELVFLTELARVATKKPIVPKLVTLKQLPKNPELYNDYFGTKLEQGESVEIHFSAEDATRPFLTKNTHMWEQFEPELQKRLSDLDNHASARQRTKSVLLELLPSGQGNMELTAKRLAVSTRTLQRHLYNEGTSFKKVLKDTRRELALHYLKNSKMSATQISFLLGFEDTNSFNRAFNTWTGVRPRQFRKNLPD